MTYSLHGRFIHTSDDCGDIEPTLRNFFTLFAKLVIARISNGDITKDLMRLSSHKIS